MTTTSKNLDTENQRHRALTRSLETNNWRREELLHLLSLSGTLAGLCITGVTLFHTLGKTTLAETVADDALAISALLFLICTYTIFFSLRTKRRVWSLALEKIADFLFFISLTSMVSAGFMMVYTIW